MAQQMRSKGLEFETRMKYSVMSTSKTIYHMLSTGLGLRKTGNRPNMTETY